MIKISTMKNKTVPPGSFQGIQIACVNLIDLPDHTVGNAVKATDQRILPKEAEASQKHYQSKPCQKPFPIQSLIQIEPGKKQAESSQSCSQHPKNCGNGKCRNDSSNKSKARQKKRQKRKKKVLFSYILFLSILHIRSIKHQDFHTSDLPHIFLR